jgi:hypothetical protein
MWQDACFAIMPGMGRAGTPRSTNLWLVPTGAFYRTPLALSERADLGAAFERGRRDRAKSCTWEGMTDTERTARLAMDGDVARAYALGRGAETSAPAPLPLALIGVTVDLAIGVWLERRRPPARRVAAWLVAAAMAAVNAFAGQFADRWQARRLALDPADAPAPAGLLGRLGFQTFLALAHGVWRRRRTGQWPRTGPASAAAARVATELLRRRSWRAALAASRDSAATMQR